LARRLRIQPQPLTAETQQNLFSANGSMLKLLGTADLTLDISGLKIPHTVYICDNLNELMILGRSFLTDSSAVIDFRNQTLTISDVLQIPLQHKIDKDSFVRAKESICVQPNTEIIFDVSCANQFNNQDVLLTAIPGEQFRKFAVANSISRVQKNQALCRLMNYTDKYLVTGANEKIAKITPFDDTFHCMMVNQEPDSSPISTVTDHERHVDDATLNKFADEYGFNINSQLAPDLRMKLLRVLYKRKDAFARSLADLQSCNSEEIEIKLKNTKPLFQRQFKHKPEHARILQHHIDEWEKHGFVVESKNYFYNNPIFLVAKAL
jgi:hypothetical protein